ncbi:MAG: alpha/beta hydrolase [Gammaproteobacteria bacterium]|nr:MAG: alpha/beta hydrolase [Gammaproteobacteria bacterium]
MTSIRTKTFNLLVKSLIKPFISRLTVSPDLFRKMQRFDKKYAHKLPNPKGARVEETILNDVPGLIVSIDKDYEKKEGVVLYFHGGGYLFGSPQGYKRLIWPLAKKTNMPFVVIDYRMAPDHVYPAALEDSISAYKALLAQGYTNITLMGDSAGGNLTLATLLKIKTLQLPTPTSAVTISPWTDLSMSSPSAGYNAKNDPYLPGGPKQLEAAKYYAGDTPLDDPLLSPAFADYHGITTPLKITVGGPEVLLDDAKQVAESASKAGVEVDFKIWPDMAHVFPLFQFLPEGKECAKEIVEFVLTHHANKLITEEAISA